MSDCCNQILGPGGSAFPRCTRPNCTGTMKPSKAVGQTVVGGVPDLGEVATFSPGGPGVLIDCLKCDQCGHSVTC